MKHTHIHTLRHPPPFSQSAWYMLIANPYLVIYSSCCHARGMLLVSGILQKHSIRKLSQKGGKLSSFKSSSKTLRFLKTFSSVPLPQDMSVCALNLTSVFCFFNFYFLLHCPLWEIEITLSGEGTAAARPALPNRRHLVSVCAIFLCVQTTM